MAKKKEEVEVSASDSNVDKALKLINKQFGPGAMMTFNSAEVKQCDAISTGSISLDLATGVSGLPLGRFVEIFGPESSGKSTICLQVCAEAQKAGYTAAFLDLENAFDAKYAKALGIDLNKLLFSQPSSMEEAFQMMEMLMTNKLVDVIIFDSIASGRTKAELNGEIGDNFIGTQARIISQALKKLAPIANEANCLCLFTNQIRMKIGVMFGCLHGETKINFDDGRSLPIGEVVKNKIKGNVYCMLPTGEVVSRPILNWFNNGKIASKMDMITLDADSLDGTCHNTVVCTPNHKVFTSKGWVEAKDATDIAVKYERFVGDGLAGAFIGDATINIRRKNTGCLIFRDKLNPEYVEWKCKKFNIFEFKKCEYPTGKRYASKYNSFFVIEKEKLGKRNPLYMLRDNFSWLNVAIWYMDDGHFDNRAGHIKSSISMKRIKDPLQQQEIINTFNEKTGLNAKWSKGSGGIILDRIDTETFQEKICKYIPKCMQYKLKEEYQNKYVDFDLNIKRELVTHFLPVKITPNMTNRKFRWKDKYDIQVEDASCYFAGSDNGMLVHNSPETTPGGLAMQFYASIRMRIAGKGQVKEGDIITARETEVKIIKNKVAPPFTTANFVIRFGKGIDKAEEVLDYAVKFGLLEKSGAWFKYNGENVAQGKEKALSWLKSNTDLMEEFTKKVKEFVKASFEQMEDIPAIEGEENVKFDPETGEILED